MVRVRPSVRLLFCFVLWVVIVRPPVKRAGVAARGAWAHVVPFRSHSWRGLHQILCWVFLTMRSSRLWLGLPLTHPPPCPSSHPSAVTAHRFHPSPPPQLTSAAMSPSHFRRLPATAQSIRSRRRRCLRRSLPQRFPPKVPIAHAALLDPDPTTAGGMPPAAADAATRCGNVPGPAAATAPLLARPDPELTGGLQPAACPHGHNPSWSHEGQRCRHALPLPAAETPGHALMGSVSRHPSGKAGS